MYQRVLYACMITALNTNFQPLCTDWSMLATYSKDGCQSDLANAHKCTPTALEFEHVLLHYIIKYDQLYSGTFSEKCSQEMSL